MGLPLFTLDERATNWWRALQWTSVKVRFRPKTVDFGVGASSTGGYEAGLLPGEVEVRNGENGVLVVHSRLPEYSTVDAAISGGQSTLSLAVQDLLLASGGQPTWKWWRSRWSCVVLASQANVSRLAADLESLIDSCTAVGIMEKSAAVWGQGWPKRTFSPNRALVCVDGGPLYTDQDGSRGYLSVRSRSDKSASIVMDALQTAAAKQHSLAVVVTIRASAQKRPQVEKNRGH